MAQTFHAYVDGFNLYKGALSKRPDLKWLDLISLCRKLMPGSELDKVYYFTSRIKRLFPDDGAPERQHMYIRALIASGVEIVYGKIRQKESWHRLATTVRGKMIEPILPAHAGLTQLAINRSSRAAQPDIPQVLVNLLGEKGTDVNLASYLLRDCFRDSVQSFLVISGDSDLTTPIKMVRDSGGFAKVIVPNSGQRIGSLRDASSEASPLDLNLVGRSQFPDLYISPRGRQLRRPVYWTDK